MSEATLTAFPEVAEAAVRERPARGTRLWFAVFLAWMIGLAVVSLVLFGRWENGDGVAMRGAILLLMCFYVSLCNSFVPLPTAWIVLLAATPGYALLPGSWVTIALVAGLASVATVVANLTEYHLLAYLLHFGLGARIRRMRVYGWAADWFGKAPFRLLALLAFVPIPIDAVRWLAILRRYPRGRFALAYLVGRFPRYVLLASCSVVMELTTRQIVLIQVGIVGVAVLARFGWGAVRRRTDVGGGETTVGVAADEVVGP